jgi:hypothetical protein
MRFIEKQLIFLYLYRFDKKTMDCLYFDFSVDSTDCSLGFVHVSNLYDSVIYRNENYMQFNDISILKRQVNQN